MGCCIHGCISVVTRFEVHPKKCLGRISSAHAKHQVFDIIVLWRNDDLIAGVEGRAIDGGC